MLTDIYLLLPLNHTFIRCSFLHLNNHMSISKAKADFLFPKSNLPTGGFQPSPSSIWVVHTNHWTTGGPGRSNVIGIDKFDFVSAKSRCSNLFNTVALARYSFSRNFRTVLKKEISVFGEESSRQPENWIIYCGV